MDFAGYFAPSAAPIVSAGGGGVWGAITTLGTQAIQAFAPQFPAPGTSRELPGAPITRVEMPPAPATISVKSLAANCGYDPALLSCFTHQSGPYKGQAVKSRRRQRIKLVPDATGALHPVLCCAPRRMNPLNPRALSRAARRIGSFQRIASNLEKIVQKACRRGLGRGRLPRMSRPASYCGPRKRC